VLLYKTLDLFTYLLMAQNGKHDISSSEVGMDSKPGNGPPSTYMYNAEQLKNENTT